MSGFIHHNVEERIVLMWEKAAQNKKELLTSLSDLNRLTSILGLFGVEPDNEDFHFQEGSTRQKILQANQINNFLDEIVNTERNEVVEDDAGIKMPGDIFEDRLAHFVKVIPFPFTILELAKYYRLLYPNDLYSNLEEEVYKFIQSKQGVLLEKVGEDGEEIYRYTGERKVLNYFDDVRLLVNEFYLSSHTTSLLLNSIFKKWKSTPRYDIETIEDTKLHLLMLLMPGFGFNKIFSQFFLEYSRQNNWTLDDQIHYLIARERAGITEKKIGDLLLRYGFVNVKSTYELRRALERLVLREVIEREGEPYSKLNKYSIKIIFSNELSENSSESKLKSFNLERKIYEILIENGKILRTGEVKDLLIGQYGFNKVKQGKLLYHVLYREYLGAYQIGEFKDETYSYLFAPRKELRLLKKEQSLEKDILFKMAINALKTSDSPLSITQIFKTLTSISANPPQEVSVSGLYARFLKYEELGFIKKIVLGKNTKRTLYYLTPEERKIINFPRGCDRSKLLETRIITILSVFYRPLSLEEIKNYLQYQDPDFACSLTNLSKVLQTIKKTDFLKILPIQKGKLWTVSQNKAWHARKLIEKGKFDF